MQKIDKIIKAVSLDKTIEVLDYVKNNGGVTLDLDCNIVTFNDGYQFAMDLIHLQYEVNTAGGVNISDVQDALLSLSTELKRLQSMALEAGNDKQFYIGVWRNSNTHQLIIEPSFYTEDFMASIILGIENNQEAIYNWSTKTDINLKGFKNSIEKGGI